MPGSKTGIKFTKDKSLEELVKFVDENTGLIGNIKPKISYVVDLDESNFDEIVGDPSKHVMVKLYLFYLFIIKYFIL